MGSKFLIYDPESNPDPKLVLGQQYRADRDETGPRGAWLLEVQPGETVQVRSQDLCNKRDKPHTKLSKLAAHVIYETAMLVQTHNDQALRAAYTAWFVHYRNLMLFFRGKGFEEDEACAQDFFDNPRSWHEIRRAVQKPPDPALVGKFESAANELAVHLSYRRDEFVDTGTIPNGELTTYVRRLLWALLDSLPPHALSWFAQAALFHSVRPKPAA